MKLVAIAAALKRFRIADAAVVNVIAIAATLVVFKTPLASVENAVVTVAFPNRVLNA